MTLGETARFGRLLFQIYAIRDARARRVLCRTIGGKHVAREKDRRTFILLLLTDLRDHEIVLGKMLGSLLPIALLLLGFLPMLVMLLLLGGMQPATSRSGVAGAGRVGIRGRLVRRVWSALWRDRTYQSLAFAVLGIVLYFCLTRTRGLAHAGCIRLELEPYWRPCSTRCRAFLIAH